jgi:hypothetical protein
LPLQIMMGAVLAEAPLRLSPRLCRAARALIGWDQAQLAAASGVPKPTVSAFEVKDESAKLTTMNNRALIEAFETAGLQFIPENGGGAGVRVRERREA